MTDPEDRRPGSEPDPSPAPEPDAPDGPSGQSKATPEAAKPEAVGTPASSSPVDFVSPAGVAESEVNVDRDPVVVADFEADDLEDDDLDDDLDDDEVDDDDAYADGVDAFVPRRWVTLVTTLGLGLVAVVGAYVVMSIIVGLSLRPGEPDGVANGLLHRLGYPFDRQATTNVAFLLLAVIFFALPAILDEDTSESQDLWTNVALVATTVLAVVIALGFGLRVRYELHTLDQAGEVPRYFRIQLVSFLLVTLGAAAVVAWGSMAAMRLRDRWD